MLEMNTHLSHTQLRVEKHRKMIQKSLHKKTAKTTIKDTPADVRMSGVERDEGNYDCDHEESNRPAEDEEVPLQ
jgi:hypothetical protein